MTHLPAVQTSFEWLHLVVPVVTLLIGFWLGHVGFKGATAQIQTDINEIKSLLHVQNSTTKVV